MHRRAAKPIIQRTGKIRTPRDGTPLERARRLRRENTTAEARLWEMLRDRRLGGWKWRRQVPQGSFIADFLCVDTGLVVELDGGQHADAEALAYDARRTAWLESQGLRVMRFWNSSVLEDISAVCLTILDACETAG